MRIYSNNYDSMPENSILLYLALHKKIMSRVKVTFSEELFFIYIKLLINMLLNYNN